jgi:hypothetical protein
MSSEGDEGKLPNETGDLLDEWEELNRPQHALGHWPAIGRRIALTVYGVHWCPSRCMVSQGTPFSCSLN